MVLRVGDAGHVAQQVIGVLGLAVHGVHFAFHTVLFVILLVNGCAKGIYGLDARCGVGIDKVGEIAVSVIHESCFIV